MKSFFRVFSLITILTLSGTEIAYANIGSKEKATFYSKATATATPTGSGKVYLGKRAGYRHIRL